MLTGSSIMSLYYDGTCSVEEQVFGKYSYQRLPKWVREAVGYPETHVVQIFAIEQMDGYIVVRGKKIPKNSLNWEVLYTGISSISHYEVERDGIRQLEHWFISSLDKIISTTYRETTVFKCGNLRRKEVQEKTIKGFIPGIELPRDNEIISREEKEFKSESLRFYEKEEDTYKKVITQVRGSFMSNNFELSKRTDTYEDSHLIESKTYKTTSREVIKEENRYVGVGGRDGYRTGSSAPGIRKEEIITYEDGSRYRFVSDYRVYSDGDRVLEDVVREERIA